VALILRLTRAPTRAYSSNPASSQGRCLRRALEAEALPTPRGTVCRDGGRLRAIIAAGLLRKCIPLPPGERTLVLPTLAIMVEELYAVNASVT